MNKIKIAINGFGRIGRIFFRKAFNYSNFEIIAINDLSDTKNLAYLLKYDTVYGKYDKSVEFKDNKLIVDGKEILIFKETNPQNLPWKDLDIDIVVESSGVFTEFDKAKLHLQAGAKRVVITAPTKDEKTIHFTPGLEDLEKIYSLAEDGLITSNASCTTNSVNPIIAILNQKIGIQKAVLTTIHAYTNTQSIVDSVVKGDDFRRGRAGAQNIVPSTTGAANATAKVIPEIKGKFDGISVRVPTITGSLSDITILTKRPTTVEEINNILKEAANSSQWNEIIKINEDQIVSSDIIGEPYGAIIDLTLTKVVDGDLVKVFSWYDNEAGYVGMLIKHIKTLFNN
ncbi:MAG: type I glyceraldehyde-3-phosphate dehydrogenase [Patescibacteria group bacterium]|nr:type I glyceraldehyde-3-phosphate dehydrogenase [Patescibacteria group bacterium]MCX7589360.1 type I glyceraldehyde-3-phosphate dehydrogenase [Patescibacteria group bacterium]MDW8279897.1 type I glyceraldehyde-3-phosphate dehydrogenase [bacterium]